MGDRRISIKAVQQDTNAFRRSRLVQFPVQVKVWSQARFVQLRKHLTPLEKWADLIGMNVTLIEGAAFQDNINVRALIDPP
jgi:hypothetical protein